MRGEFTMVGNYTWSKEHVGHKLLNPTDPAPEHVIDSLDPGQTFTLAGVYELPIGRGRHWGQTVGAAWSTSSSVVAVRLGVQGPARAGSLCFGRDPAPGKVDA